MKNKYAKDEAYLEWIKKQSCCVSGTRLMINPHHYGRTGKGIGQKCSDYETVPLSWESHQLCHRIGNKKFQALYGINFEFVGEKLRERYKQEKEN